METYVGKWSNTNNMCRSGLHELTDDNIYVFKRGADKQYRTCLICFRLRTFKSNIRRRYHITWETYCEMLKQQDYKCKICGTTEYGSIDKGRFCIDHDHGCCPEPAKSCGKCIRGLLCFPCNRKMEALDKWTDDELQLAVTYRKSATLPI